jgi:hypothetical protein
MKGRISVTAAIIIFLASCEKGETDNTILKFYSKSYKETGNSIAIIKDNETGEDLYYYICGQFTDELSSNAKGKPGVYRSGLDGNMIDTAVTLSGYEGSASRIIALGDGDMLCTGYVLDEKSEKDIFIWKLNPDLTTDALKIYDSDDNQYGVDMIETSGGFLVLATTDTKREPAGEVTGNPKGKKDILLMKIDDDLNPLAAIPAVGYNGNDEGAAVKKDINGGFIVVGTTDRSDLPADKQAGTNIIIVKLNENGNTTEPRIVGGIQNEAAADFEVLTDGYLIAGTTGSTVSTQQGCIWKMPEYIYDSVEYKQQVILDPLSSGTIPYSVKAMCRYKTNSFLLAGQYNTGLSARMLVFSIDVYGTTDLNRIKKTGGTGTQIANDVASGESGNIIAVGSNSFENNSMVCFLKFRF